MLYSVSAYNAQEDYGDPLHYMKTQMIATVLGLAAMVVISRIDYHIWIHFGTAAYLVALVLCTAVMTSLGSEHKGQSRWFQIGPFSFQPSEFAKLAVILFLAGIVCRIPKQMGKLSNLFKVMLLVVPLVIVVAISNLSTAVIILGVAVVVAFIASPKIWQFVLLGFFGAAGGTVFIFLASYRATRIKVWLHPEDYISDEGFQTVQGLYAIGSGGLFGKGLGQSMQKLGFVPEAQNDMIFSIICEELGLFGAICVIWLFLLLLWRFMVIANNAADLYGSLIVAGIMAHIAIQVILNIGVVTATIPNTGITLPFISYGGTSTCFLLAEMGLALSVSRGIRLEGSGHD